MTDPATLLAGALPADPTDHGPIAVPSDTVRQVLTELVMLRQRTARRDRAEALVNGTYTPGSAASPDGGT